MLYILADTNVYLHFKHWEDNCWASLIAEEETVLILPPITVSEIDDRKSDPVKRIRKRARKVLAWLRRYRTQDQPEIQPGLRLEIVAIEPTGSLQRYSELDPNIPDDRFLATALSYRERHPEAEILVVSNDAGVLVKSDHWGLRAQEPPETCKLPDTKTEEEIEIDRLKSELAELRDRAPDLSLRFQDQETVAHLSIGPTSPAIIRYLGNFRDAERFELRKTKRSSLRRGNVQGYLERLQRYLTEVGPVLHELSGTFAIQLELRNDGSGPGDDVQIILEWDEEVALVTELPDLPRPPTQPKMGEWPVKLPQIDALYEQVSLPPVGGLGNLEIEGPYAGSEPKTAQFRVKRVHQQLSKELPRTFFRVQREADISGFSIRFTIIAANLPRSNKGELNVVLERSRSLADCLTLLRDGDAEDSFK